MPPIYLAEQGAKIRAQNHCILIEKTINGVDQTLYRAPVGTISQMVLFGNISLTTPAISLLLEHEIEVVFLSVSGKYRGRLSAGMTPHVKVRRAQYLALEKPELVMKIAASFIHAKIKHQKAFLQRHNRETALPEINKNIELIRQLNDSLAQKVSLNSLRGAEGKAAAAYFESYRHFFGPEWKFERRQQRPSPDCINAMLSFGYTLLAQMAVSAVEVTGLDPYAGFLHAQVYNRPSLGLDIMEEFRPVIDGVVLWCCRSGQVTPHDFSFDDPLYPCVLKEPTRKKFIQAFEQRMDMKFSHPVTGTGMSIRQCLIEQARQIGRWVLADPQPYQFLSMGFR